MPRTRVHNLFVSSDGFAAGDYVTLEQPIGEAQALFARFDGRVIHGIHGVDEPVTVDRALFSTWGQGIGAEIMGRRKYGPQTGEWTDDGWQGWWGDEPPFRTPVFVLTHHVRPSFTLADTTFHFLDASPQEALERAFDAADGKDVRIGGGVATVRQFLDADLIDTMHVAVAPVELGRGERLWEGPEEFIDRFHLEQIPSPSGVVHHFFWRR